MENNDDTMNLSKKNTPCKINYDKCFICNKNKCYKISNLIKKTGYKICVPCYYSMMNTSTCYNEKDYTE